MLSVEETRIRERSLELSILVKVGVSSIEDTIKNAEKIYNFLKNIEVKNERI